MTARVFDASALLALLGSEAGSERVEQLLHDSGDEALVSAANMVEVLTKLIDRGVTEADAALIWRELHLHVVALDEGQATAAALLRVSTRPLGLSLGDRCCLALAQSLPQARVVTADQAWKALPGFRFDFVR